ncbi:MAG TPA: phosphotransferase, partial [Flavisolibacter sp.]|nr:phosphotransferase [Flavisolibacter sp.]
MSPCILAAFGLQEQNTVVEPFGSGLINHTWRITTPHNVFILQKINHNVFREPAAVAHNHRLLADYLRQHHPDYFFVEPVQTITGEELVYHDQGWYRLLPFVSGSHTIDVVDTPQQAYEAARQFGRFTR